MNEIAGIQAPVTKSLLKGAAVIVGCEESQVVTIAFRELGIEAFSCDLLPCSGGHPEWHLQMDIFEAFEMREWALGIFHPECTRLTVAANKYYKPEYAERFPTIHQDRQKAVDFFMRLANSKIERYAIENPIGIMSSRWRKPDQIIQPYQFGHTERKGTCLWLKNLPKLKHTKIVQPEIIYHKSGRTDGKLHYETLKLPKEERRKARSRTFEGIGKAMAEQWGLGVLVAAPLSNVL